MMKRRQFAIGLAQTLAGVAIAPWARAANPSLPWADDIASRIPGWLREQGAPGMAIAIVDEGRLAWRGAFGVRDVASKLPIDHDTVFEACSVSKPVFAYMVMKLCERGLLDLDTPLTRYTATRIVPDDSRLDLITTRSVLSHTTGLPNWRSAEHPLAIEFAPGSKWSYSGEGYHYLQTVVAQRFGRIERNDCGVVGDAEVCAWDFDEYMKALVLRPFGMMSSGYLWSARSDRRFARGHSPSGEVLQRHASRRDAARYGAAGGLHTTATDYARFLIELIRKPRPDAYRLSEATRREMVRPQIRISDTHSWALGWQVERNSGGEVLTHSGDNPGFKSFVAASVGKQRGCVMLTNGDTGFDVILKVLRSEGLQQFLAIAV